MKTKFLGVALGIGALWLWAPGCSQPEAECTVGSASAAGYAAKFTFVDGDQNSPCGSIPGDTIGLQQYNHADGDVPDNSVKYLAIQTEYLGHLFQGAVEPDPDETHKPYALGAFSSTEPDGNDLCTVPTLSPARLSLNEVPGEGGGTPDPEQTAVDLIYEWSNVNLYVTAALPGNQLQATLKYTEDGCSATYNVVALWPAIGCEKLAFFRSVDPEMSPCEPAVSMANCAACAPSEEGCEALPTGEPEEKLCDDQPDREEQYQLATGSGIAPDLEVVCDPKLLMCVLNSMTIPKIK